jgi:hypothetical protein
MDRVAPLRLADIVSDQPLQIFARIRTPDTEDGAGF